MRFAMIVLLLSSFVAADDATKMPKESVILSPEKQMEKAVAEYQKMVTDFFQYGRKKTGLVPGNHLGMMHAMMSKGKAVVKLSQSFAIQPNDDLYKKSKARRIELANQLYQLNKKSLELEKTNPDASKQFTSANKSEDLSIELSMVSLLEQINTPQP